MRAPSKKSDLKKLKIAALKQQTSAKYFCPKHAKGGSEMLSKTYSMGMCVNITIVFRCTVSLASPLSHLLYIQHNFRYINILCRTAVVQFYVIARMCAVLCPIQNNEDYFI